LLFLLLAGGEIQWDYIHGLFDQAVYGGRVDNPVDTDVLRSYLMEYFNSSIIGGSKGSRNKLTSNVNVPNSTDLNVYDLKRIEN
jgi:dynein heavy chain 2